MTRTVKKILLGLSLILLTLWLIGRFFFKSHESYEPELLEFKSSSFDYKASKPIYFYFDNKLFYNENGILDLKQKPIWKGEINDLSRRHVFVSPDSRHIAINVDDDYILILNNTGKEIGIIKPIAESLVMEDRSTGVFLGEHLQWNMKSTDLYIMQDDSLVDDKIWHANKYWDTKSFKKAIYKYSIIDKQLKKVITLDERSQGRFYLNKDESQLYYQFADSIGKFAIKKIELRNNKTLATYYSIKRKLSIPNDSIFINYKTDIFWNSSHNLQKTITTVSNRIVQGGLYLYQDSLSKLIFKGTHGYHAFKGSSYSFLTGGEFLPGDQYYLGRIKSKEYDGSVIIDTESLKYIFIDKKIECFFSITNDYCLHFDYRLNKIHPNTEWETSVSLIIEGIK
ncbi:hypothetical protein JYT51_00630 [Candidatus Amoebophilus asiaticus]|nr:hypothetical protein [Candidatus Amoebophilus asiaticus]